MENAEVDVALEELENRLERLRALYEQYFMGIERIEPAIPRKDVDRRIYVLRREKIRNTAKRFKLQTIISRYNTFQQYWQRICREIEAGTYKRHVIRAERIAPGKMLTIAARKRMGRAALEAAMPDSAPPPARDSAPPSVQPETAAASAVVSAVVPRPSSVVPRPGALAPAKPPPKPGARPAKPSAPAEPIAAAPPAPRARLETLDLDLDFLGDWDPSASAGKPKGAPEIPARPFGRALNQPLGAGPPAPAHAKPPAPVAKLIVAPAPPPAPPRLAASATGERPPIAPRPPPAPPLAVPARPAPPRPRPPLGSMTSVASGPAAIPARPAPGAPFAPAKPMGTPFAKLPALTSAPAKPPLAKPAAPSEAALPRPAPPKPPAAAAAATPAVSDERVRELHARLVEAKRQTQDPGAVSMEGLAKSMKATEAKLREQHKNRKIDFDVVIKDGRAVLKPIVR